MQWLGRVVGVGGDSPPSMNDDSGDEPTIFSDEFKKEQTDLAGELADLDAERRKLDAELIELRRKHPRLAREYVLSKLRQDRDEARDQIAELLAELGAAKESLRETAMRGRVRQWWLAGGEPWQAREDIVVSEVQVDFGISSNGPHLTYSLRSDVVPEGKPPKMVCQFTGQLVEGQAFVTNIQPPEAARFFRTGIPIKLLTFADDEARRVWQGDRVQPEDDDDEGSDNNNNNFTSDERTDEGSP